MEGDRVSRDEPIAIIGLGCRFPGGVDSAESFWQLMLSGTDAIVDVPKDRWNTQHFYHPDAEAAGRSYVKQGGFLTVPVDQFDPLFFGISPREAEQLDPQQRLLLEVTWEALENGGAKAKELAGSRTGVFIGGFCMDSMQLRMGSQNRYLSDLHTAASSTMAILSNRVSHVFDFRGPSISLDTACSSSLVTTHLACQSLKSGESDIAIAGGVNVMLCPETFVVMSKGRFLSPHGRCMMFDERAAGYARGEGAGVVVLKKLSRARADHDRIYALIRASGVNQDGRTPGISMPRSEAQIDLMGEVFARAGVVSTDIDYVEAHGTGTQAGDPKEAFAIHTMVSQGRSADEKCLVGSVKTNIGHLEAAAGVAGLIKTALCLYHGKVPPNLHFKNPNPEIPLSKWNLVVPKKATNLPEKAGTHYAAVNSFGYGGTNANVVLESVKENSALRRKTRSKRSRSGKSFPDGSAMSLPHPHLLPVTAEHGNSLKNLARRYAEKLNDDHVALDDLLHTAACRRSHLTERVAVLADTRDELASRLLAFAEGKTTTTGVYSARQCTNTKPVFIYSGIGPQWWGMGQELMRQLPLFSSLVKRCDKIFKPIAGWSIWQAMNQTETSSAMKKTEVAQPANTVLQIAITDFFREIGIIPAAVVGHSAGEMAAAYASGALTCKEALRISIVRSRLQATRAGSGTMLAVGLSEEEAKSRLAAHPEIDLAAVNSLSAVTLAGSRTALVQFEDTLKAEQIFARFLPVEVPYHSRHMEGIQEELLSSFSTLSPKETSTDLYSTVTGKKISGQELGAGYWWRNVRQVVRFNDAINALFQDEYQVFMEIAPHPVLSQSVKGIAHSKDRSSSLVVIPTLRRGAAEVSELWGALAQFFCAGGDLAWNNLTPKEGQLIGLPNYPWNHSRHWKESKKSIHHRFADKGQHPFLGRAQFDAPRPTWQSDLSTVMFPYLREHKIADQQIFPGAGFVECALALGRELRGDKWPIVLRELHFEQMLPLEESVEQSLLVDFEPKEKRFAIHSKRIDRDKWTHHASGRLRLKEMHIIPRPFDLAELKQRINEKIDISAMYRAFTDLGMDYGEEFQRTEHLYRNGNETLAELNVPEQSEAAGYLLHPTLLDAAFHPFILVNLKKTPLVPVNIEQVNLYRPVVVGRGRIWCYARTNSQSKTQVNCELHLISSDGEPLASFHGVRSQYLRDESKIHKNKTEQLAYVSGWQKLTPTREETAALPSPPVRGVLLLRCLDRWVHGLEREISKEKIPLFSLDSGHVARPNALANSSVTLNPACPEHYVDALAMARERGRPPVSHVVFCWPLKSPDAANLTCMADDCMALAYLLRALEQHKEQHKVEPEEIIIITRNAQRVGVEGEATIRLNNAPFSGLAPLIANEFPSYRYRLVDLDQEARPTLREILLRKESDLAVRRGKFYAMRLRPLDKAAALAARERRVNTKTAVKLVQDRRGEVNSLCYELAERCPPLANEVEIRVNYVGINYKDMLKVYDSILGRALEKTHCGYAIGVEAEGTVLRVGSKVTSVKPGDSVIAMAGNGGFCSYLVLPEKNVFLRPKNCLGTTVVNYVSHETALYGLEHLAKLEKGERVLIHSATSAVGLAAIQIAKRLKAEIFATAGSEKKRNYLKELGVRHVMDSRSLSFAEEIRAITDGAGVDVVLNTLAGEGQVASLELLAPYGRFIELGKRDMMEDHGLPLSSFNQGVSFFSFDMDRIYRSRHDLTRLLMTTLMEGFASGRYQPTPTVEYKAADVVDAFRSMARAKSIGRVVIKMADEEVSARPARSLKGPWRRDGSYIITGGCHGFGLEVAKHLADAGAGQLILVNRSGAKSNKARAAIAKLKSNGSRVEALALDITDKAGVEALITRIMASDYPLRGILHGAMVLEDAPFSKLERASLLRVMAPKVAGALNLIEHSNKVATLDHCIFFSSVSSQIGNRGQASYIAANAVLDGMAHFLRQEGVPALTINWGALAESGVVANNKAIAAHLKAQGIRGLGNREAMEGLSLALETGLAQVSLFSVNWQTWSEQNPALANASRFVALCGKKTTTGKTSSSAWLARLLGQPEKEGIVAIRKRMTRELARILRLPEGDLHYERPLSELGIDSLMGIELSLAIQKTFAVNFSSVEMARYSTLAELTRAIHAGLESKRKVPAKVAQPVLARKLLEPGGKVPFINWGKPDREKPVPFLPEKRSQVREEAKEREFA